jgi:hypothetical protein
MKMHLDQLALSVSILLIALKYLRSFFRNPLRVRAHQGNWQLQHVTVIFENRSRFPAGNWFPE